MAFHRGGGSDYLDPLLIVSAEVGPEPIDPLFEAGEESRRPP